MIEYPDQPPMPPMCRCSIQFRRPFPERAPVLPTLALLAQVYGCPEWMVDLVVEWRVRLIQEAPDA